VKTFDTLSWIRRVRESRQERQRGLSDNDKLKATRTEAERFRASRPEKKTASSGGPGDRRRP